MRIIFHILLLLFSFLQKRILSSWIPEKQYITQVLGNNFYGIYSSCEIEGTDLVAFGTNGYVKIWNSRSGEVESSIYMDFHILINVIKHVKRTNYLIAGNSQGYVMIVDYMFPEKKKTFIHVANTNIPILDIAPITNTQYFAVVYMRGSIRIFTLEGLILKTLSYRYYSFFRVIYLEGTNYLLLGSNTNKATLIDYLSSNMINEILLNDDFVRMTQILTKERGYVVTGGINGKMMLFDHVTLKVITSTTQIFKSSVRSIDWIKNSNSIIVNLPNENSYIVDFMSMNILYEFNFPYDICLGTHIARTSTITFGCIMSSKTVFIEDKPPYWNTTKGFLEEWINDIIYIPEKDLLVVDDGYSIIAMELSTKKVLCHYFNEFNYIFAIYPIPNSMKVFFTGAHNGTYIFDYEYCQITKKIPGNFSGSSPVSSYAASLIPNTSKVIVTYTSGTIDLIDISDDSKIFNLKTFNKANSTFTEIYTIFVLNEDIAIYVDKIGVYVWNYTENRIVKFLPLPSIVYRILKIDETYCLLKVVYHGDLFMDLNNFSIVKNLTIYAPQSFSMAIANIYNTSFIISSQNASSLIIYDFRDLKLQKEFFVDYYDRMISDLISLPNTPSTVVAGTDSGDILLIDYNQKCKLNYVPGDTFSCIKTCPEGKLVVLDGTDICVETCPPGFAQKNDSKFGVLRNACELCMNLLPGCDQCELISFNNSNTYNCTKCFYKFASLKLSTLYDSPLNTSNIYSGCDVCHSPNEIILNDVCYSCSKVFGGNCDECQLANNSCSKCKTNYYLSPTQQLFTNICLAQCPPQTFPPPINNGFGTCKVCTPFCKTCLDALSCSICETSYFLEISLSPKTCTNCTTETSVKDGVYCRRCSDFIPNCKNCFGDREGCSQCTDNFYLLKNESTGKFKCDSCQSSNLVVRIGSLKDGSGSCLKCQDVIKNCKNCSSSGLVASSTYSCNVCEQGFFRSTSLTECVQCDPLINPDKFIDPLTNTCKLCSSIINYCQTCNGNPQNCTSCQSNYFPFTKSIGGTLQSCVACTDSNQVLNNNICLLCENLFPYCSSCNNTSCVTCKSGYRFLKESSNESEIGKCVPCNETYQYVSKETITVTNGLSLDRYICKLCSSSIQNCDICYGNPSKCGKCKNSYYLFSTKDDFVFDSCSLCNSTLEEIFPFGPSDGSGVCKRCKEVIGSCVLCSESNGVIYCDRCASGYYLFSTSKNTALFDKCVTCTTNDTAVKNDSLNDGTGVCLNCQIQIQNCNKCQANTCLECLPDWYIYCQDGRCNCSKCIDSDKYLKPASNTSNPECLMCSSSIQYCTICNGDPTRCYQAQAGFFLYSSNSSDIFDVVKTNCSSPYFYVESASGLTNQLSGTQVCRICSHSQSNCNECTADGLNCLKCLGGYFLKFSETESKYKCVSTCADRNFYKKSVDSVNGDVVCQNCREGLKNCLICSDDSLKCTLCEDGYFPVQTETNKGCLPCLDFLSFYTESDRDKLKLCLSCDIYNIKGCQNCKIDPPKCLECLVPEYYQANGVCVACNTPDVFPDKTGLCLNCSQALPNCRECNKNPTNCSKCEPSFYLKHFVGNNSIGCVKCTSDTEYPIEASSPLGTALCETCGAFFPDCTNCDKQKGTCTKCSEGRFLLSMTSDQIYQRCVRCDGFDYPTKYITNLGICVECNLLITGCLRCSKDPVPQCFQCQSDLSLFSSHKNNTFDKCIVCEDQLEKTFLKLALPNLGKGYNLCLECGTVYPNCGDCDNEKCLECSSEEFVLEKDMLSCDKCIGPELYIAVSTGLQQICSPCSQAIPFCAECYGNSLSCVKCEQGHFRFSTKEDEEEDIYDKCVQTCTDSTRYIEAAANNTCRLCSNAIEGCEICNGNPKSCLKPKDAYYLISTKGDSIFDKTTYCTSASELKMDETNKICSFCNFLILNCETCSGTSNCSSCRSGFYLYSSADNTVYDKCIPCDNDIGKYINKTVCQDCSKKVPGCEKCTLTESGNEISCSICKKDQFPISSAKDGILDKCLPCNDFLKYYTEEDRNRYNYCSTCNLAFQNCKTCTDSPFSCSLCLDNFLLFSSKNTSVYDSCISCDKAWLTLSIKNGNDICMYCGNILPNCLECSGKPKSCSKCEPGYYLFSQIVEGVSLNTCVECRELGLFRENLNCGVCGDRFKNCIKCNIDIGCLECKSGLSLYSSDVNGSFYDSCIECPVHSNIKFTDPTLPNQTKCKNCSQIIPSCSECTTNDAGMISCIKCASLDKILYSSQGTYAYDNCLNCASDPSKYISANNICLDCSKAIVNCEKCGGKSKSCDACSPFYFKYSTANDGNYDQCVKCDEGQQNSKVPGDKSQSGEGICVTCSIGIPNCSVCKDSQICLKCEKGYFLHANDKLKPEQLTCVNCKETNNTIIMDPSITDGSGICLFCDDLVLGCKECDGDINNCFKQIKDYICDLKTQYLNLTNQSLCESCSNPLPNCKECNGDPNNCFLCSSGYYLYNKSPKTSCVLCSGHFFYRKTTYSPGYSQCYDCSEGFEGCALCSSDSLACDLCSKGRFPVKDTSGIIESCISCARFLEFYKESERSSLGYCLLCEEKLVNCKSCEFNSTNCLICNYGFYLYSTQGGNLYDECVRCEDQGQFRKVTTNAGDGICITCSQAIENCETCNNTQRVCTKCKNGYYLQKSSGSLIYDSCVKCDSFEEFKLEENPPRCIPCFEAVPSCRNCDSKMKTCSACLNGKYLYLNSTTREYDSCIDCMNGPYYKLEIPSNPKMCWNCNITIKNCISCNSTDITDPYAPVNCQVCEQGYFLISSQKKSNIYHSCITCLQSNQYKVDSLIANGTGVCKTCDEANPFCEVCNGNPAQCEQCQVPYYLLNNSSGSNASKCVSCLESNYYKNDIDKTCHFCQESIPNCLTCSGNKSHCSLCMKNFYLFKDLANEYNRCIPCDDSKLYFKSNLFNTDGSGVCFSCSSLITGCDLCGYDKNGAPICLACVNNKYLFLDSSSSQSCRTCTDGNMFIELLSNGSESGYCKECRTSIKNCEICNGNPNVCLKCSTDYYILLIDDNNGLKQLCDPCSEGLYYLVNPDVKDGTGICKTCKENIKNCFTCTSDGTSCRACQAGFFLSSSLDNGVSDSCVYCNMEGYYIDNIKANPGTGKCLNCNGSIANCANCKDSVECIKCQQGYFMYFPPGELYGKCVKCDSPTQYVDKNNLYCLNCRDNSTLACNKCKGGPLNCQECERGLSIIENQDEGTNICGICFSPAEFPYYPENSTQSICKPCKFFIPNCQICSDDPSNCLKCAPNFFRYSAENNNKFSKCIPCSEPGLVQLNIRTTSIEEGVCMNCSSLLPSCVNCSQTNDGSLKCDACQKSFNILGNGIRNEKLLNDVCVRNCPKDYFLFARNQTCLKSCPESFHIEINICTSDCPIEKFLFDENNTCVIQCPEGYVHLMAARECAKNCTEGLHLVESNRQCLEACPEELPLQYLTKCVTTCPKGYYKLLPDKKCVEECPITYFRDNEVCVEQCPKYNSPFLDGSCFDTCPDKYFPEGKACKPCHLSCKTCNGLGSANCLSCANGLTFFNNGECGQISIQQIANEDQGTNTTLIIIIVVIVVGAIILMLIGYCIYKAYKRKKGIEYTKGLELTPKGKGVKGEENIVNMEFTLQKAKAKNNNDPLLVKDINLEENGLNSVFSSGRITNSPGNSPENLLQSKEILDSSVKYLRKVTDDQQEE